MNNVTPEMDLKAKELFGKIYKFASKEQKAEVRMQLGLEADPKLTPDKAPEPEAPASGDPEKVQAAPPPPLEPDKRSLKSMVREDRFPKGTVIGVFECPERHKTKNEAINNKTGTSHVVRCMTCGKPTYLKYYTNTSGGLIRVEKPPVSVVKGNKK